MENNYLVILCAHVDSEDKKNSTIETLIHLYENNIDVCLSLHSNNYLDELSQYAKYVIYDKNNEYLLLQDYLDNAHYIDNVFKYGQPSGTYYHDSFNTTIRFPGSPHSKSALSLLRNGLIISELNNYKWTIYLEYDICIPKEGFKIFFNNHLEELISLNKKCYYYDNKFDNFDFLWGGFFMFKTEDVFKYKKFIKNEWYKNKSNWVKEWYIGFFESIVKFIFNDVFSKDEIIIKRIQNSVDDLWGVGKVSDISKFRYEQTFYKKNKYLRKYLDIHVYPEIINKKINLHIYCNNKGDQEIIFNKIIIYGNNTLYYNVKDKIILPYHWFTNPLNYDNSLFNEEITLEWFATSNGETYYNCEKIKMEHIYHIHKNILYLKSEK